MSILNNDLDIKFHLGNHYTILSYGIGAGDEDLISEIRKVELDDDLKIPTRRVRSAVRKVLGEKYRVKRVSLPNAWRFECELPDYKEHQKKAKLWGPESYTEFFVSRAIKTL